MSLIAFIGLSPSGTSLQALASPDSGRTGECLADFLSGDVQANASTAHEIIQRVDEVKSGALPRWERNGNAYTLSLEPDGAWLNFSYGEEEDSVLIPLSELRNVLQRWAEAARNSF